jgi:hypothetical protein
LAPVLAVGLVAGGLAVPSIVAATPPDLSGVWVNTADMQSDYNVVVSPDRTSMGVTWRGVRTHSGLAGSFKGTLASTGDRYNGAWTVTEAGTTVNGTGTFAISSQTTGKYPLLNVKLTSSSGGVTLFRLQIWLALPHALPGPTPGVDVPVNCSGSSDCRGQATGDVYGSNPLAVRLGASAHAARATRVGSVAFRVKAGHSATIVLKLNKTGRAALSKHGTLQVRITVTLTASGGLPHKTNAGTVTLHKH